MKSEEACVGKRERVRKTVGHPAGAERLETGRVKRGARKEVRILGNTLGRISKLDTTWYYKKNSTKSKKFLLKVLRST
jgi:hypothetical protein